VKKERGDRQNAFHFIKSRIFMTLTLGMFMVSMRRTLVVVILEMYRLSMLAMLMK
jgi:hypothetical protein